MADDSAVVERGVLTSDAARWALAVQRAGVADLCAAIHREVAGGKNAAWPPILGVFKSVVVTLTYSRRNRVQQELAEV